MFDKLISANRLKGAMSGNKDGLADILREWINAQPEVRVIPIEWLEDQRKILMGGNEYQQDCADSIYFVMRLWQGWQEGEYDGRIL